MKLTFTILLILCTCAAQSAQPPTTPTPTDIEQVDTILQKEKVEVGKQGDKTWTKRVEECDIILTQVPEPNELPIRTYRLYTDKTAGEYILGLTTQGSQMMSVCINDQISETKLSMGFVSPQEKPAAKEIIQFCHDTFLGRHVTDKQREQAFKQVSDVCPNNNKM